MDIKTVTVIGSTGTMGRNVAGIFASFGNARVYMLARNANAARRLIPEVVASVRADSIANNLVPAGFSQLEECVGKSDLVFESVAENLQLKKQIAERVGAALRDDAVSCSGTSGLSVTELAECYPERLRGRFFGVHMFNPPYNLQLCEFCATKYSDPAVGAELKEYLSKQLIRSVVEVRDMPAFLGNRVGFRLINMAMQYSEQYSDYGGIDYIDAVLGEFTGCAMPPLVTADFVGLDVHKAIVDNLYANTSDYAHETFRLCDYANRLVDNGCYGKKTKAGLYKTIREDNGKKQRLVYDIDADEYREIIPYEFPFAKKMRGHIKDGNYHQAIGVLIKNHSQEAQICLRFIFALQRVCCSLQPVRYRRRYGKGLQLVSAACNGFAFFSDNRFAQAFC